jgi:transketolase
MSGADTSPKAALSEGDKLAIDTIRTLAIDAVQKANSGHAGAPMALAPVAYTLWNRYLRYDPAHPHWPNRDRFVLSAGHASMLLYGLLHLARVAEKDGGNAPAIALDDIKKFRQLDSRTPGHPEYHFTTGVETTTGPLGQGVANSVGMAIGGRFKGERLNRPDLPLFDYNVYAICSDGDLMEGVSQEAASIAGHLRLSNLCWIYDNNTITIEGHTELAFSEEVAARFLAYGWQVLRVADANDTHAIASVLETFLQSSDRPTLIIVNSIIGYGAPTKQNTAKAHSDALGPDEVKGAKRAYGWPEESEFLVPDGVYDTFADGIGKRGAALSAQ